MNRSNSFKSMKASKALTDDIATNSSPNKYKTSQKLYRTLQFKDLTLSGINSAQNKNKVWNQSASSRRRQKSPSFAFPKADRFTSIEKDERDNRLFLKLDIAKQLSSLNSGTAFGKSTRTDHFEPKGSKKLNPAPNTYYSDTLSSPRTTKSTLNQGWKTIMHISEDYIPTGTYGLMYEIDMKKGRTIGKFEKVDKMYMHHGRNMAYQPEVTKNNPGVGKYEISSFGGDPLKNRRSSTMGKTLKKFNELIKYMHQTIYSATPGPGSYINGMNMEKRSTSNNQKGTFALSQRTYMKEKNPEEYSPSPSQYQVRRFLEK